MRRTALPLAALAVVLLLAPLQAGPNAAYADEPSITPVPRRVDLVLCLDTSGSMSGLINAAREKLWKVVEELSMLEPMPLLRVALLTYGSPGHESAGHVVVQTRFSEDVDMLAEKLDALKTNGGTEYVGRVMKAALDKLNWTRAPGLKLLFVAGNESADQDTEAKFEAQAAAARERGIDVTAIYCGGADDADASSWRELAAIAKGRFANIDHNNGTVRVATPFDAKLTELSSKLNETYEFYGKKRKESRERQKKQDASAEALAPGAAADRAVAKAGTLYRQRSDLVESFGKEGFDLAKIAEADLPEKLRAMTLDQRKTYLTAQAKKRAEIAAQVKELSTKRTAFIQAEMKRRNLDDTKALDRVLRDAIREQAASKGFKVPADK